MQPEDPPSSSSMGRNPFDDEFDEEDLNDATSLCDSLDPPAASVPTVRASSSLTSRSPRSMSEIRKTRGALIGGHTPNELQSTIPLRNDEISVAEGVDLESCAPESDYTSRGRSFSTAESGESASRSYSSSYSSSGSGSGSISGSSQSRSERFLDFVRSQAASVASRAESFRTPSIKIPSFRSASYRSPGSLQRMNSVGKLRYGTNLSPHADDYEDYSNRRKLMMIGLATISIILIGAIIAIAVVIFGGSSGDDNSRDSTASASARENALDNILVRVTRADVLSNPSTPQAMARKWLLYEDTLWIHPAQVVPGKRVIQRYILAVLYFATEGPTAWSKSNWLNGSECSTSVGNIWTGVACNDDDEVLTIAFGELA